MLSKIKVYPLNEVKLSDKNKDTMKKLTILK